MRTEPGLVVDDRNDRVDDRRRTSLDDEVVLLGIRGERIGTARKSDVHGTHTPLHLAISCYVVRPDGRVLLTRRSSTKRTWPGVWSNACCGHPRPGEPIEAAVRRHMFDELGMRAESIALALPDFTYRAVMPNGISEHEICPVHIAVSDDEPQLDPDEADSYEWVTWTELVDRAASRPDSLSPWSVTQIERLASVMDHPHEWARRRAAGPPAVAWMHAAPPARADPFALMGSQVADVMREFVAHASAESIDLESNAGELCDPIRALIEAGGKRLRPCLVYCGFEAAAGHNDRAAGHDLAHVAAAVEMLHTFALLHDDVMDRSALRRGRPTAHERFDDLHHRTRSSGSAAWFGISAAIVAGDLAFVWADELLDRVGCDAATQRELRALFTLLRREVIVGQYLDLRLAGPHATDHQAQLVSLLKSGRYTVTRPLQLGAVLGGADELTMHALREYGDAAGVAFQLRDDVMGVFGDETVTGKGSSEDIRSGKASLLLVRAIELAQRTDREVLLASLGDEAIDEARVDRCRDIVSTSGALASIERLIDAKVEQALDAVHCLPDESRARLSALAIQLAHRHV
ncbi:MAG: Isopentenyl-diphosphate Delta-isomerase [Acidimicrobiales bacterium]|nr:Isopentenyl-diphosphate Delta-isomerase [Acidimicrobiales bacterium]